MRAVTIGETGKVSTLAWNTVPSLMSRVVGWALPKAQSTGKPPMPSDNLHSAGEDGRVYLDASHKGIRTSLSTKARLYPGITLGLGVLATAGVIALARARR